ncbi:MAG: hypothetical protein A7315_06435 [Candidatus Altiarchaeales archaeon WOR_SM1_79]|nr:MAG: hypothetical protein A7315_06435 [Candidatus Altiarchaeales archaeon WOR_SM1_79]
MNESFIEPLLLNLSLLIVLGIAASYISSRIVRPIRVPEIFALMLLGIIVGPVLNIFNLDAVSEHERDLLIYLLMHISLLTLLFEGGFNTEFGEFKKNIRIIGILASLGIIITAACVGAVIAYLTGIPLIYGVLIGAVLSATDPASVISLGRALRLPKRITTILEGESAYNDATAIILFLVIVDLIGASTLSISDIAISETAVKFLEMFLGGIFIGGSLGILVNEVLKRNKNEHYTVWITILLASISYFTAEHFGVSGVISAVTAGMVLGVRTDAFTPREHRAVQDFWEFARFGANSIIFLVLGTLIDIEYLANIEHFAIGFVILISLVLIRLAVVEIAALSLKRNLKCIITWAGVRGSIPIILAISIAGMPHLEHKDVIIGIISSVVFLSITIQGLTSAPLVNRLIPTKISRDARIYEELKVRERVLRGGLKSLDRKFSRGDIDDVA